MAAIASLWVAGCAVDPQSAPPRGDRTAPRARGVLSADEAERARTSIAVGKSSKADVLSALGKAGSVLIFESGFEVWVYRVRGPQHAKQSDAEFVLLFAPSGVLAKTRLKPPVPIG
jgi:hypothetical protein